MEIHHDTGTYTVDNEGNLSVDLTRIARIDLENLVRVRGHRIMRDAVGTVHEIEFQNGGTVRISYTNEGTIREFTGTAIAATVTNDNVIVLREGPGTQN